MLWGLTILLSCVLLSTSCGAAVPNPGPTTEAAPPSGDSGNFTCSLPGHQYVILQSFEYKKLPGGILLVSGLYVNASSYALHELSGEAEVCVPPCEDSSDWLKPLFYALLAVILYLQVPLYVSCSSLTLKKWSSLIYFVVLFSVAAAYIYAPFCRLGSTQAYSFKFILWYSLPCFTSAVWPHLAGGLALLHSDSPLAHLAEHRGIPIIAKRNIFKSPSFLYGCWIFLSTYTLVLSGVFDDWKLVSFRNDLPYFLPSFVYYLLVNLSFLFKRWGAIPWGIFGDPHRLLQDMQLYLFVVFLTAFPIWRSTQLVVLTGSWRIWQFFAIFSFFFTFVLSFYLFYVDSDEEDELDDETIWTPTTTPEKTKRHKKDIHLALIEKTAADMKKTQPVEVEYELAFIIERQRGEHHDWNEVALLVEKTGEGDQDGQRHSKEYELMIVDKSTGPVSKKEPPVNRKEASLALMSEQNPVCGKKKERYHFALVVGNTEADKEKQPVKKEYEMKWLKVPDLHKELA